MEEKLRKDGVGAAVRSQVREDFERDGVTCVRGVFTEEWINCLREATEKALEPGNPDLEAYSGDEACRHSSRFVAEMDCSRKYDGFARFVLESNAAEVAAAVMQSARCNFFYDILFVKEPETAERTVWHQDAPYWAIAGDQVCSIWIPLDQIPQENCLEFVAGSHRWPTFAPFRFSDGKVYPEYENGSLPRLPDIEAMIQEEGPARDALFYEGTRHKVLRWELEPGDALVFQRQIVHSAPPNASKSLRRRAFSTRWAGDDATFVRIPGVKAAYPNFEVITKEGRQLEHGEPIASAPRPFPRLFAADESDAELVAKQREIRAAKESVHGGAMSDSLATVLQPMETKAYLDLRRQAGAKFSRGPERDRGLQGLVH